MSSTNSENINHPEFFKILPNVVQVLEFPRRLYYKYNYTQFDHKEFYDKYENKKYNLDQVIGILKDDIAGGP